MNKLRIGIIGIGFMGKMHFDVYRSMKNAEVAAMSDPDPKKRAGDWSAVGGNIGAKGSKGVKLDGIAMHEKADDLIADETVDAVDITAPTFLHEKLILKALKAGKPVICEKPMAVNSAEGGRILAAAKESNAPLFFAHCIRFWPEYQKAKEIVDSGRYGRVIQASFTRLSMAPGYSWDGWNFDPKRGGSAVLDLHIHDVDYIQHLFGIPNEVSASACGFRGSDQNHIVSNYYYRSRKNLLVTAEGGWLYAPGFGFTMQFRIHMEKATMTFGMGADPDLAVHPLKGKSRKPRVARGDGYQRELAYFVDCIRKGKKPKVVTPESSAANLRIIEAELKSAAANGKPVKV